MHVSLNRFTAGPNGEMDWIHVNDDMLDFAGKDDGRGGHRSLWKKNLRDDGRLLADCR